MTRPTQQTSITLRLGSLHCSSLTVYSCLYLLFDMYPYIRLYIVLCIWFSCNTTSPQLPYRPNDNYIFYSNFIAANSILVFILPAAVLLQFNNCHCYCASAIMCVVWRAVGVGVVHLSPACVVCRLVLMLLMLLYVKMWVSGIQYGVRFRHA